MKRIGGNPQPFERHDDLADATSQAIDAVGGPSRIAQGHGHCFQHALLGWNQGLPPGHATLTTFLSQAMSGVASVGLTEVDQVGACTEVLSLYRRCES